jgi:hypothetical protein
MMNGKKYSKKQKGDYMIKIENIEAVGWEHAIRGMRNPKNSWNKSDSLFIPKQFCDDDYTWELSEKCGYYAPFIKDNDHKLMMSLAKGGPVHAKYRRMITVYMDVTAPLYWWKEYDTYKVGTVANSCSTMHKIHAKEFELDDFSIEHLSENDLSIFKAYMYRMEANRKMFLALSDPEERKEAWYRMIQLLPTSYNQKRTVMLNYEVLHNIYHSRRHHKLDEWHVFCDMIENLPYSEIITGVEDTNETNA